MAAKPVKRKLECKDLETKYLAIKEVEAGGKTKTAIAQQFGVPANTLSTWIKNKSNIIQKYESSEFGPATKRMRAAEYPDLEKAVDIWFKQARAANVPINGPLIQARAQDLASQMGHSSFKASSGWLHRFKQRHGYQWRSIIGESKSVPQQAVADWKATTLTNILQEYSPDDVFNADETGLFWRMEPKKSFVLKGETCSGGKQSKERVTVLPCANMSGSEKLPLLVIGKFEKPRCFKGITTDRLPTEYKHNNKAWMTRDVFTPWVKKLDSKMTTRGRKIALVLDNCTAHPDVQGLRSVKLVFLPPNTTSLTQPMDQGIIQNLKVHYRHLYVKRGLLPAVEKGETPSWNLLDCMMALKDAWRTVTPTTIKNCYRHCGFTPPAPAAEDEDSDPEDDLPLAQIRAALRASNITDSEEDIQAFLDVDSELATTASATDEEIISQVQTPEAPATEDEEEEDQPALPPPTFAQACDSIAVIRRFLLTQPQLPRHDNHWQLLSTLEEEVQRVHPSLMKQKTMTDFFTKRD